MLMNLLQFALLLGCMTLLVVVMGKWLARVFTGTGHTLPHTLLERWSYRLFGVNPDAGMGWAQYGLTLLVSNAAMLLLGYLLLRLQSFMPLNPLGLAAQSPDLAFNTAVSFTTNTNWQAYSGETSLSNFSQMAVITFLMSLSATTGLAAAAAFIRGLSRKNVDDIGNYWVDMTRILYRVFLPLCFVMSLVYVWQGMPQTLASDVVVTTLEGVKQHIILGAVASFETIKHIGTNGGGFFSMNAAHPFENPSALTNALHILSMLLIPSALTYAFGSMLFRRRQGWVFFGAFLVMFLGFLSIVYTAEQSGNPLLTAVGADQTLRHRRYQPVRDHHHGGHHRFGRCHARFIDPHGWLRAAGANDAELGVRRCRCGLHQPDPVRHFGGIPDRHDDRPQPGVPRQEDRDTRDEAGDAGGAGPSDLDPGLHRTGDAVAGSVGQPQ